MVTMLTFIALSLHLPLISWKRYVRPLLIAVSTAESNRCVDNTSEAFTSAEASSNSKTIALKIIAKVSSPPPSYDRSKQNSVRKSRSRTQNPSDTNSHPAGQVGTVLSAGANYVEIFKQSLTYSEDSKDNGEDAGLKRNGHMFHRDGLSDGHPSSNRGSRKGALLILLRRIPDTRIRSHQEYKDT